MRIGFNTLRNHLSGQSPAITRGRPRQKKLIDQVKTPVGHDGCKDHAGLHTSPEGVASVEDNAGGIDGSKGHALLHASYEGHSPTITRRRAQQKKLIDKAKTPVGHGFASFEHNAGGNDGSKGHAVLHASHEGHSPTIRRGQARQKKFIDKAKTPVGHGLVRVEDNAGGNDGSKRPSLLNPSGQDWIGPDGKFDSRSYFNELFKELRSDCGENGKVRLNGVWFDSQRDPNYIRMRNENFCKIAETFQFRRGPNGEGLFETWCRLHGVTPFYEDPEYENGPKPVYGNPEHKNE